MSATLVSNVLLCFICWMCNSLPTILVSGFVSEAYMCKYCLECSGWIWLPEDPWVADGVEEGVRWLGCSEGRPLYEKVHGVVCLRFGLASMLFFGFVVQLGWRWLNIWLLSEVTTKSKTTPSIPKPSRWFCNSVAPCHILLPSVSTRLSFVFQSLRSDPTSFFTVLFARGEDEPVMYESRRRVAKRYLRYRITPVFLQHIAEIQMTVGIAVSFYSALIQLASPVS